MSTQIEQVVGTIGPEVILAEEVPMVRQERWEELRRLWQRERVPVAELARRFELDRKTVRRCLRAARWRPYQRPGPTETLLTSHAEFLRARAPKVRYSAQILFQELRGQGYRGSYNTVKRFVRPLRVARLLAEATQTRFETPPGARSQIDWGTATVRFRHQPRVLHVFVLTLGFSRRGFYTICPNETVGQLLDYDGPRTVCQGTAQGRIIWNPTFRAFADYWGFEPRVCRPYRAQTKGKVESGVKYFKGNFLPGREFVDDVHLHEQLAEWMATIADLRIHGTTHERPIDHFAQEQGVLVPTTGQPSFRLEALLQEATSKELTFADFLDQVLTEEVASKTAKHVTMRTQLARFPFVKGLDAFDFSYQPSLDKKQVQTLSACHFIEHGENLVILARPVWARPTSPSGSASRRSSTATASCSRRPPPSSRASPAPSRKGASRTG